MHILLIVVTEPC